MNNANAIALDLMTGRWRSQILHAGCTGGDVAVALSPHPQGARVFIAEYNVPGPGQPDFSKLFDIHMMVALTGRERREEELVELLATAGWKHEKTWRQPATTMVVIEGVRA